MGTDMRKERDELKRLGDADVAAVMVGFCFRTGSLG